MNGKLLKLLLITLVMTCVSTGYVKSQSLIDTYGNYAGSHSALLNPSLMTTSNVYADFGLNIGVNAGNNYFHIPSKDAYRAINDTTYKFSYEKIINGFPRYFDVDFNYGNNKPATANVNVDAVVLSGMYNFKGKHAVGFFARARANVNIHNLPSNILEIGMVGYSHSYSKTDGYLVDTTVYYTQYARDYSGKNLNLGVMAWSEFGLSYSTVVFHRLNHRIDLGVNAKLALAVGAVALNSKQLNYHLELGDDYGMNDSLWFFDNLEGGIAYSLPLDYDTPFSVDGKFNENLINNHITGYGGGIDIGVTYTCLRNFKTIGYSKRICEVTPMDYIWRLGFTILDLGAVHFGKDAEIAEFNAVNSVFNTKSFNNVSTVHQFTDVLTETFDSEIQKKGFWMGLPTSLSLQFDYSINRHFFVNATVIQPIAITRYHVSRDAQISLSPRFESHWCDVTIPVTVVNYERVLVGTAVRAAFLTVGTQNLLNLIGIGEIYGLDFYVSLKFNFNKGRCLSRDNDNCLSLYQTPKKHKK